MIEFSGRIGHLEGIESPWSNSGGVAKTVADVETLAHTGVGSIEAGSFTLEKRTYRGPCEYNELTGEMHNCIEMDNCGMDEGEASVIPEMVKIAEKYHKPLIVNVATVTDKPEEEAVELVRRAYEARAHAVLLNPECPNLDIGPLSENPQRLWRVLTALADAGLPSIFLKLAPQGSFGKMNVVAQTARVAGNVRAIYVSNSLKVPDSPIGAAGKSGPAMAEEGYKETFWATLALRGNIDVVSCWGINNAAEIERRLRCGAVACAGTTFFYVSENGWQEDVDRLLTKLAA